MSQLVAMAIAGATLLACVLFHAEVMHVATNRVRVLELGRRLRVVTLMLCMITAHVVEIWVFAVAYLAVAYFEAGYLEGPAEFGALDYVYFSAVSFTTLGFGDLAPHGAMRVLSGTEALAGLSLVTWSASLAFFDLQRAGNVDQRK